MSKHKQIKIEPNNSREVEYRIRGYLVKGSIPIRAHMNPSGRFYAGRHDENRFFKYIGSYLGRSNPKPHTAELESCPPMTITSITRTKVTSLENESRLRDHKYRYARSGERGPKKDTPKEVKSTFSLYMDRPFQP
jgi:hypothetical protein